VSWLNPLLLDPELEPPKPSLVMTKAEFSKEKIRDMDYDEAC